jgi:Family of unknown function (DUF6152)
MKRKAYGLLACGLLLVVAGVPALAHHSFAAAYDMTKPITIEGVIDEVRLTNPHSWFVVDVKDADGKVTQWKFEAGTPSGMLRNGFKKDVIKHGAEVTITGFHAKDPTLNVGMLRELTTKADGKKYGMFGPQEGPGAQ